MGFYLPFDTSGTDVSGDFKELIGGNYSTGARKSAIQNYLSKYNTYRYIGGSGTPYSFNDWRSLYGSNALADFQRTQGIDPYKTPGRAFYRVNSTLMDAYKNYYNKSISNPYVPAQRIVAQDFTGNTDQVYNDFMKNYQSQKGQTTSRGMTPGKNQAVINYLRGSVY